jgi:hypothetical protein
VRAWPHVRTEVKSIDRKIEALLASTDPHSFDDGTLTLVASYPFHAGKLNETKIRSAIEDAIERATGQRVAVTTLLRGDAPPPSALEHQPEPDEQPPASPRAAEPPPAPVENGHSDDEEVVRRFAAILDAEEIPLSELNGFIDNERRLT